MNRGVARIGGARLGRVLAAVAFSMIGLLGADDRADARIKTKVAPGSYIKSSNSIGTAPVGSASLDQIRVAPEDNFYVDEIGWGSRKLTRILTSTGPTLVIEHGGAGRSQQLAPGSYPVDERSPNASGGIALLRPDIKGATPGYCRLPEWNLDIHEVIYEEGQLTSLWLDFEYDCGLDGITSGEVRINPPPDTGLTALGLRERFTEIAPGAQSTKRTVRFVNTGTAERTLGIAMPAGPDAEEFEIVSDDCSISSLAPGQSCELETVFAPSSPGPKLARIELSDDVEAAASVALEGSATSGASAMSWSSQVEGKPDSVQGLERSEPSASFFVDSRERSRIVIKAFKPTDRREHPPSVEIESTTGTPLEAGADGDVQADISDSIGCGYADEVNIEHIEFDRSRLTSLVASWRDECTTRTGERLRDEGEVAFRPPTTDDEPPQRATDVEIERDGDRALVTWRHELLDFDRDRTIVRYFQGPEPPASVLGGRLAYSGTLAQTTIRDLDPDLPLSVAVFTVDKAGNVSEPRVEVAREHSPTRSWIHVSAARELEFEDVFTEASDRFAVSSSDPDTIEVSFGESDERHVTLEFGSADGTPLRPGVYGSDRLVSSETDPPPLLSFSRCDLLGQPTLRKATIARLDIKRLERDASGNLEQLWANFEVFCWYTDHSHERILGEINLGVGALEGPAVAVPRSLRFEETHPMAPPATASVWFENRTDERSRPSPATVTGPGADAFSVRADRCAGRALDPGRRCEIRLAFDPDEPGPFGAELVGGTATSPGSVQLDGYGLREELRWRHTEEPDGEEPSTVVFDPSSAAFGEPTVSTVGGIRTLEMAIEPFKQSYGSLDDPEFAAAGLAAGGRFEANPAAARYPMLRPGRNCAATGEFTLTDPVWDRETTGGDPFGTRSFDRLESGRIDYSGRCAGANYSGEIDFFVPPDDFVAPSPSTGLTVSKTGTTAVVSWSSPEDSDRSIVSYLPGSAPPALPSAGIRAFEGSGGLALITGLDPDEPISVSVFEVDAGGNVSDPTDNAPPAQSQTARPQIEGSRPHSPSRSQRARLFGSATDSSTVRIYAGEHCLGTPVAVGEAESFGGSGLEVEAAENRTSAFSATAQAPGEAESACSRPLSYTHDSIPPDPVAEPYVVKGSAGSDPVAYIRGTIAADVDRVSVYRSDRCQGPVVADVYDYVFRAEGARVSNADGSGPWTVEAIDAAGNRSSCSSPVSVPGGDPPRTAPPSLGATTPVSPSSNPSPGLTGTAPADSTVRIYAAGDCGGDLLNVGSAESFASPGLFVLVPAGSTASFVASAQSAGERESECSPPISYTRDTIAPRTRARFIADRDIIRLASSEAGSTYECRRDGRAWRPCVERIVTRRHGAGEHALEARATDRAGNVDATPAVVRYTVG